jgi:diacylglycerol O-acyltransferase
MATLVKLNPQDEYFLDTDTIAAPTHIGGLEIYDLPEGEGRDYLQKLYAYLRKSPVRAEPFNYKLVTVGPDRSVPKHGGSLVGRVGRRAASLVQSKTVRAWAKVSRVNVDDHIHLHALPRPGGQRELGELVARLHMNRLDRSRPLWEVHLIEGLAGGRYAVYTKLHHSQFDGKRGMEVNRYVRSTDPATRGLPPMWAVDLKQAGRAAKPVAKTRTPQSSTLQTLASWGTALQKVGELSLGRKGAGAIPPYTAPASILNGPLTPRRRLGTQSLSLARMKALGSAVPDGATVNEVVLAVCGGALRRHLLEQQALPKRPLIAACPVAISRQDEKASGNAVGQILVSLATNVADPKRRLLAVVASSRANKGMMLDFDLDTYTNYTRLSMIPQVLAAKTPLAHRLLNANLVISNVPGPRETQYVNGARLEAMYATSLLLAGQALNITVSNFGGNLDMGILACPDLCPSPQRIAVYAGEELEVLERALGLKPARAGRRPGTRVRRSRVGRPRAKAARGARKK